MRGSAPQSMNLTQRCRELPLRLRASAFIFEGERFMKQKYRRGRSQKRPSRKRKKNIFPIALVVAGDAPLTISRAYTTCGCTTAEISASVIPPGKVATVKMVFDAGYHDTRGQTVRRGLIIENNDPAQSEAEIWLVATVRSS
jgi:hypothetical protein